MLRREKGFTLIELLIVIAIIGILAAIAIPMYRAQTIKAKMTEVTNGMSNIASAVAAYFQENETWPTAPSKTEVMNSLGVSTAALSRMEFVSVTNGVITATLEDTPGTAGYIDSSVAGRSLSLIPVPQGDGSIQWSWSGGTGMPPAYIPKR